MATANPPPKTAVSEWCKVFHTKGTENYTSSVTFTKQLTVVALSIITYMKNTFPENCYTVETFAGLRLKILKKQCSDDLAQFLSSSLIQAFEALDKKYLHQLALCFYEEECKVQNLIEYHIFEYNYSPEGVSVNIHSKKRDSEKCSLKCTFEDVKKRTTQLIRTCLIMMQACQQELPSTPYMSIRLYYNDDAPDGYQAPGFSCDEGEDHLEPTISETFQLGWVKTPYHKTTAKSYMRDSSIQDSREAIPSLSTPRMTQTLPIDFNVSIQRSETDSPGLKLRCPCNKYEDIGSYQAPLLITCQGCNTLQHAACFGLAPEQVSRLSEHFCTQCVDEDPSRRPTDPRLASLSHKKRECLCIFRRTLEWCSQLPSVDGARLVQRFGISNVNAAKLMKLLDSYGIVALEPDSGLITPKPINAEKLQIQIGKYFQSCERSDLADLLLAETFGSQESNQVDPLGKVLGPMEQINLQNTNTLGHVIENPGQNKIPDADDTTLWQYREAIRSVEPAACEETPLAAGTTVADVPKRTRNGGKRKMDASNSDEKPEKKPKSGVRSKSKRTKRS